MLDLTQTCQSSIFHLVVLCINDKVSSGGYKLNEKLSQFSPALRWMTYEAVAHGLQMTPFGGEWNDNKPQTNSLKGLWHIPELLPVLHPDHLSDESSQRFHRT